MEKAVSMEFGKGKFVEFCLEKQVQEVMGVVIYVLGPPQFMSSCSTSRLNFLSF